MKLSRYKGKILILAALIVCTAIGFTEAQTSSVSPFGGIGNVQFLDNNGNPLTGGVLYTYQAGTTTQQASYTDSTGSALNPDPVPLSSGGRASIWLLTGNFYKLVLCTQNDGASCAPGDTLFSVDQVPGGTSSGGGSSSSPFISGSANPATTGILRLASGDTICWRNAGGSANLCWSKDGNDLLSWAGGSLKFPEVTAPAGVASYDVLWADATAHRWMMSNSGGVAAQVVASGVDINTSDQVTQLHFGSTPIPLSLTAPATSQLTQFNGTNLIGISPAAAVTQAEVTASQKNLSATATGTQLVTIVTPSVDTLYRVAVLPVTTAAASSCSPNAVIVSFISWTDALTGSSVVVGNGPSYNPVQLGFGATASLTVLAFVKAGTALQGGIEVNTAEAGCATNSKTATEMEALP